jgi:Na+/melibiose symporter-like transporter
VQSAATGEPASSGTVMVAALPVIIGIQFLIAFLHYDVSNVPREALSPELANEH